ncbi:hypothetical protein TNCV_1168911 [Trichonephila clavipes]|uniref:Uncharacterized protein n=1 Tax=Trichonephila clavipes TaxID=2585209 RepID=A0A8X6T580_TRICX|nr:hypothetical protein TNCV_1168911 [Trichonephila clavipes]
MGSSIAVTKVLLQRAWLLARSAFLSSSYYFLLTVRIRGIILLTGGSCEGCRYYPRLTYVPRASTKLVTEFEKEVHSSIKQTIRFILTLGARYNTGLRTCPTGDELCFYTLRNIREIPSMHSKE